MNVDGFTRGITEIAFAVMFVAALLHVPRRPVRVHLGVSLLFACVTVLVISTGVFAHVAPREHRALVAFNVFLLASAALLLVRQVSVLLIVPTLVMRWAQAGYLLLLVGIVALARARPSVIVLLSVAYVLLVAVCCVVSALVATARSCGIARRRAQAIALGSFLLILLVGLVALASVSERMAGFRSPRIIGPLALAAGLSFLIGFVPPKLFRRAWRELVLAELMSQSVALSRLSDTVELVRGLEFEVRRAVGGLYASIGLWDDQRRALSFPVQRQLPASLGLGELIEEKVIYRQQPIFIENLPRDDPGHESTYRANGVRAVICAPVSAGGQRIGVVSVYAHAPHFDEDDVAVVRMLVNQVALVLECHRWLARATQIDVREQTLNRKDDFLATAAHDLKSPLTAVALQAQLLERRARRDPNAPIDMKGIAQLIEQSERLQAFVSDLLDVERVESQGMTITPRQVDLSAIVIAAADRVPPERYTVRLVVQESIIAVCDRARIAQLLDNLITNAVKYSPAGGEIGLHAWHDGPEAHITVSDHGIGIPRDEQPFLFERFRRGREVDQSGIHGVGLGLYICRAIAEAHGGEISVVSEHRRGSTFHVVLPIVREAEGTGRSGDGRHQDPPLGYENGLYLTRVIDGNRSGRDQDGVPY